MAKLRQICIDSYCSEVGDDVDLSEYAKKSELLDLLYPVGSIYTSVNSVSPDTFLGGTWERIQDTFLLASGTSHAPGTTGGSESQQVSVSGTVGGTTLTAAQSALPQHAHTLTNPTVASSGAITNGISGGSHQHQIGNTQTSAAFVGMYGTTTGLSRRRVASNASGTGNAAVPGQDWNTNVNFIRVENTNATTHTHNLPNHTHTLSGGSIANNSKATADQAHTHTFTGTDATVPTIPPYLAVYVWKRTE